MNNLNFTMVSYTKPDKPALPSLRSLVIRTRKPATWLFLSSVGTAMGSLVVFVCFAR